MDWTKKAREFLEQHKFIQAAHIASFASEVERLTLERAAKELCNCCVKNPASVDKGGKWWHCCSHSTHQCKASKIRAVASSQGGEQG